MRARAGETFEIGKRVERQIDFAGRAAKFVAADAFEKIGREFAGIEKLFESEVRVDAGRDDVGGEFSTILKSDAASAAVLDQNFDDRSFGANFDASFTGSIGDGVRDGARTAAAESPGTERAVDFAHVVVEENVGGAGRTNAEECTDDTGSGHGGFEDIGFEPLVEKIGGAHGHELHEGVALVGSEFAETLHEKVQPLEIFGIERGGVGRNHREQWFNEAAHGRHHLREFVVGFGVETGVAANVADGLGVVVDAPEIVAAGHGRKGAIEGKDFQTGARKIEFANNFGTGNADHVKTIRKKKARDN